MEAGATGERRKGRLGGEGEEGRGGCRIESEAEGSPERV